MTNHTFTLGDLTDADRQWLLTTGQPQAIAPDAVLIREGERVNHLYIVLEGELILTVTNPEVGNQQVAKVTAGDVTGEMSFLDGRPSVVTAQAATATQVLSIPKTALTSKLKQDGGFAARFYGAIAAILSNRVRGISSLLMRSKLKPSPPLRKVLMMFGELSEADIDWLCRTGTAQHADSGTVLIREGRPADALYLLIEGTLAIYVMVVKGMDTISQEKEIARLAVGEIVGEMSFVDAQPPSATVKVPDPSLVLAIPRQQLSAKLQQDQGFATRFYRSISLVLLDRLRTRLASCGFARFSTEEDQPLDEDLEFEDELDLDVLEQVSVAGTRFDWLSRRVQGM